MDRYHIMEELGSGRCSTVYRARERGTLQYRAIKSVEKKSSDNDPTGKERMDRVLREVKIIYRLKHPNILRFYNWYETTNHLWLILEYCTGGDLLNVLTQDRQLPESTVKVLGVDLLAGLQHLHYSGVLYCDLKPSNVLIDEYGVLKLCDFGLARDIPTVASEDQKTKRGTPCYMAPELYTDDGVYSCASDLWALGCVLYEMVVGVPPFVCNSFEKLVDMILASPLPRPAKGADGKVVRLSRNFRNLLEGLLCKIPADRLTWKQLLDHPFWSARPTPAALDIPKQPLFEASVRRFERERSAARERRRREREERRAKRKNLREERIAKQEIMRGRDGSATKGHEDGQHFLDAAGSRLSREAAGPAQKTVNSKRRDHRERDDAASVWGSGRANALRMSRIAQQNLDRERDSHYNDLGTSHDAQEVGDPGAAIGGVDKEIDFDDGRLSPVSMPHPRGRKDVSGAPFSTNQSDGEGPLASRSQSPANLAFSAAVTAAHETSAGNMYDDEEQSEEELEESRDEFPTMQTPSPRKSPSRAALAERRVFSAQARGRRKQQLDEGRVQQRPTTADGRNVPEVGVSSPAATAAWGTPIVKPERMPRGDDEDFLTILSVAGDTLISAESVKKVILRVPAKQVTPISGNDAIEHVSPLRFNTSLLSKYFSTHSLPAVMEMDRDRLYKFMDKIHRALESSNTPQNEIVSIIGYFGTLCGVASLADYYVASPIMRIFVQLCRKHSKVSNVLIAICKIFAKIFRHATLINEEVCSREGVMQTLIKLANARNRKVRRVALAALGELLFYITTEDEDDYDNGPDHSAAQWVIPGSVMPLLLRCLKSEDSVLSHYTCKTFDNIYSQAAKIHMGRFVTTEIAAALVDIASKTGNRPNAGLSKTAGGVTSRAQINSRREPTSSVPGSQKNAWRQSAMDALGQLALRVDDEKCEEVLHRVLSDDLIPALLEGMSHHIGKRGAIGSRTRSRVRHSAGAHIDIVNYILLHSNPMRKASGSIDTDNRSRIQKGSGKGTLAHVVRNLAEKLLSHARFLPCVMYTLEHAPSPACKGRALLCLQMAVANNFGLFMHACRRKLLSTLDRLWNLVSSDTHQTDSARSDAGLAYLKHCLTHTCKFLVQTSVSHTGSVIVPIENAIASLGRTSRESQRSIHSPMAMRKIARVSASAQRTFPALLQLLNSNPMAPFFRGVSLVSVLTRHVRMVVDPVYAGLASIVNADEAGIKEVPSDKIGYRRSVFLLIETLSQRPTIVSGNHGAIVSQLLPAVACCLDAAHGTIDLSSEGGNYLLLSLRIISHLLTNVFRVLNLRNTLNAGSDSDALLDEAMSTFVEKHLLPKYSTLLGGTTPDPLPQLALKILCILLDHDTTQPEADASKKSFVSILHQMRLVRRIITNLSHMHHEENAEASVHAAQALWYILQWKGTSMLELHRFDLVHRLRKATVIAFQNNASACFEPLLACTEAVLLHACKMVRGSFENSQAGIGRGIEEEGEAQGADFDLNGRSLNDQLLSLKEVREYCRELLKPEYVLSVLRLITSNSGESPATAEEIRLRASQCLLLMGQFLGEELFDLLADKSCLSAIETALLMRNDRSELLNVSHEDADYPSKYNISTTMRLLQLLVFAMESGRSSSIFQSLASHRGLVNALRKCESSADSRDLHIASSGSWSGLSVSALSHILMQKMR